MSSWGFVGLKKLAYLLVITFVATALLASKGSVAAQDSVGVAVSPPSFDFSLDPGASASNVVKVTNPSNADVELDVRVENISGATDLGQVQLTSEETEFALSKWVTVSPARFRLKAKEVKTISFTIKVPANAEPGGHYGSILIGTVAAEGTTTGSSTVQRVGSLLLVRIAGKANEKAIVTGLKAKSFVGLWDATKSQDNTTTYFIPKEEKLEQEKVKSYFNSGPVAFDLKIKNDGNVHIRPTGFVTIYNIFGKKVAELAIEPRNVFPGVERKLTVLWPEKSLWGGHYRAQLVAVYGQSNQSLTAESSFWAFPATAAIIILAALVIIVFARKRLLKVIKVLARG